MEFEMSVLAGSSPSRILQTLLNEVVKIQNENAKRGITAQINEAVEKIMRLRKELGEGAVFQAKLSLIADNDFADRFFDHFNCHK